MLHKHDTLLQSICPAIMVPKFGPLDLPAQHTHRFLVAGNGIFVEALRPWLHLIQPVGKTDFPLPYGHTDSQLEFHFSEDALAALLGDFVREAAAINPKEHACWYAYGEDGELHNCPIQVLSSGNAHISYERPSPPADQCLAVDIHSHGAHDAFFSGDDDRDDVDDVKLAIVVGNLSQPVPTIKARLIAFGLKIDLSEWIETILHDTLQQQTAEAGGGN